MARTSHRAFCSSFDHLLHLPLLLFLHASVRASLSTGARPSHNSFQRRKPPTRKKKKTILLQPFKPCHYGSGSLPPREGSFFSEKEGRKEGSEVGTREDGTCTPCTWARERSFQKKVHEERGGESRGKKPGGVAGVDPESKLFEANGKRSEHGRCKGDQGSDESDDVGSRSMPSVSMPTSHLRIHGCLSPPPFTIPVATATCFPFMTSGQVHFRSSNAQPCNSPPRQPQTMLVGAALPSPTRILHSILVHAPPPWAHSLSTLGRPVHPGDAEVGQTGVVSHGVGHLGVGHSGHELQLHTNGRGECDASRRHPRRSRCAHVRIATEVGGRSTYGSGHKDGRGLGGHEGKDRRNGRIQTESKLTGVVQAYRRNHEDECDNHRDRAAGASGRSVPGRKSVR